MHLSVFLRLVPEALSMVWPGLARQVRGMFLFVAYVDDSRYNLHDSGEKTRRNGEKSRHSAVAEISCYVALQPCSIG